MFEVSMFFGRKNKNIWIFIAKIIFLQHSDLKVKTRPKSFIFLSVQDKPKV